jgi:GMP synthase (glutamine-hydrolysing)
METTVRSYPGVRRTLIVQHEIDAPSGLIGEWLDEHAVDIDVLRIDIESRVVDPIQYDLIVSLGSDRAAYDDSLPFVATEQLLLRQAVEARVPVLGICFGAQLLARALGGDVSRARRLELGWVPVHTRDPELIGEGPWFQWHSDAFTLPPTARLIAESDVGPQAYIVGRSLGLQFHPEVTPTIVEGWLRAYPQILVSAGVDPETLFLETARRAADSRLVMRRLLQRYLQTIAQITP